jgi:DNA invertase Pin-like site-specific DNA recombinase
MQMAVRDALISFMAASAQAQLEATKEAQKAGIANAKEKSAEAYKGRKPSYNREQMKTVLDLSAKGTGIAEIARTAGLSRQTVYRIVEDPAAAEKALTMWRL